MAISEMSLVFVLQNKQAKFVYDRANVQIKTETSIFSHKKSAIIMMCVANIDK